MNAAGLDVRTEKPVTKQSVGKIWEKIVRNIFVQHLIPERDIFFQKQWANPGFISVTVYQRYLSVQWDFLNFKIEDAAGKCTDFGIPAVLYDKTRIPDSCQRKDISG